MKAEVLRDLDLGINYNEMGVRTPVTLKKGQIINVKMQTGLYAIYTIASQSNRPTTEYKIKYNDLKLIEQPIVENRPTSSSTNTVESEVILGRDDRMLHILIGLAVASGIGLYLAFKN